MSQDRPTDSDEQDRPVRADSSDRSDRPDRAQHVVELRCKCGMVGELHHWDCIPDRSTND